MVSLAVGEPKILSDQKRSAGTLPLPAVLRRFRVVRRLAAAMSRFQTDDCALRAAAVAFFSGLSVVPSLLLLLAGLGYFFEASQLGRDAEQAVLNAAARHLSPSLQAQIREVLDRVQEGSSVSGPVGMISLLFAGLGGFVFLDRSFDRISETEVASREWSMMEALRDFVSRRIFAFVVLIALAGLVVVTSTADLVLTRLDAWLVRVLGGSFFLPLLAAILPMASNFGSLILLYRWVPRRSPSWSSATRAAIVVAVLWELGRQVLALWLSSRGLESAYGVIGAFLLLQLWIYYAAMALLFGAEYAFVIESELASDRGDP